MTSQDDLLCMFTATVSETDGEYTITVPESEIDLGTLDTDQPVRVGLFDRSEEHDVMHPRQQTLHGTANTHRNDSRTPPVEEGETRNVVIETIGDKGDGIAKVENGYVLIIPGTDVGDEVKVCIERVTDNYAMGDVVETLSVQE